MTNVVLFMSDEHNFKFSSVYGDQRVDTPNMERLAADGVVYDAAYCPSPLCSPCRASVMSGLPVHQTQVYNNCCVMTFDYPSYGAVLDRQGMHSAYAGKTDTYNHSSTLGFTTLLAPGDRKAPGDINFRRDPLTVRTDGERRASQYGVKADTFDKDTNIVEEAVDWLTSRAPELDVPWTLTVNTIAPHFPLYVTEELWEKYADGGDLPEFGVEQPSANHPYAQDLRRHFQTHVVSEEQVRGQRRGYLGRVDYVDTQLGRVLDALDQTGAREDTVVIYTSDHGEMLGKFGMWWKSSMYDDALRVPLIVSGPGFASGTRIDTPVSLLDVQATLFRATGAERPEDWWGAPLQDIRHGDQDRVVLAEYHGHGTRSGSFMVRKGPWKLLFHGAAPHQLFNIACDPEELENRYHDEPDVVQDLERELRQRCDPEMEFRRAHAFERRQLELLGEVSA